MEKFNLNSHVYVKLNYKGKRIVANHYAHSDHRKPDSKGFYKFQMWEFMNVFGQHLMMTADIISEENCIYFDENDFIKLLREEGR